LIRVSDPPFDVLAARPMTTAHDAEMEPRPAPALILLARNLWSSAAGRVGLTCVLLIVGCAILDTWIVPYDPNAIDVSARLAAPSFQHWLGADQLGRDLLSRIIDGSRVVMGIVVIGVGVALAIGMAAGVIAGYGFRTVGAIFALFCDVIRSLPMMLFALAVASLVGTGLGTVTLIVIMFLVPVYFRVSRNQTVVLKQSEYVTAARAMGASSLARDAQAHLAEPHRTDGGARGHGCAHGHRHRSRLELFGTRARGRRSPRGAACCATALPSFVRPRTSPWSPACPS
jgi:ABC-type antimicrobial peptide transport system permease subunit